MPKDENENLQMISVEQKNRLFPVTRERTRDFEPVKSNSLESHFSLILSISELHFKVSNRWLRGDLRESHI